MRADSPLQVTQNGNDASVRESKAWPGRRRGTAGDPRRSARRSICTCPGEESACSRRATTPRAPLEAVPSSRLRRRASTLGRTRRGNRRLPKPAPRRTSGRWRGRASCWKHDPIEARSRAEWVQVRRCRHLGRTRSDRPQPASRLSRRARRTTGARASWPPPRRSEVAESGVLERGRGRPRRESACRTAASRSAPGRTAAHAEPRGARQ